MFSHSDITPHGSPMMAASAARCPSCASHLDPSAEPASSSAVRTSWSSPDHPPDRASATAAYTIAAIAAFMSPEPRPRSSPPEITGSHGSVSQRDRSPGGLVSVCPERFSVGPGPSPGIRTTTLGLEGCASRRLTSVIPNPRNNSHTIPATALFVTGRIGTGRGHQPAGKWKLVLGCAIQEGEHFYMGWYRNRQVGSAPYIGSSG